MKNNKSFTLLELLVVIAIIGLLSAIIYVSLDSVRYKAQTTRALHFETQMQRSLMADLLGYWSLDETLEDLSGNNHGVWAGTEEPIYICENNIPNKKKCAVDFSENNVARIHISPLGLQPSKITISLWAKISIGGALLHRSNANHIVVWGGGDGTQLVGITTTDGQSWVYVSVPPPGNWYHTLFTYDGSEFNVYINGRLSSSVSTTGSIRTGGSVSGYTFGAYRGAGGPCCGITGLLSDVHIYSKVLDLVEIKTLYYTGLEKLLVNN